MAAFRSGRNLINVDLLKAPIIGIFYNKHFRNVNFEFIEIFLQVAVNYKIFIWGVVPTRDSSITKHRPKSLRNLLENLLIT